MTSFLKKGLKYIDRGNLASHDFESADFTVENAWTNIDLSSIVPVNAKQINLLVQWTNAVGGFAFKVRDYGNSNEINIISLCSVGAAVVQEIAMINITSQKLQYYLTGIAWKTAANISILGWWI